MESAGGGSTGGGEGSETVRTGQGQGQGQGQGRNHNRNRNRNRRGKGRGGAGAGAGDVSATTTETGTGTGTASLSAETEAGDNVRGRGRQGGRGRGRGRGRGSGGGVARGRGHMMTTATATTDAPRREFGGRLTRDDDGEGGDENAERLRADAPEFVPGGPQPQGQSGGERRNRRSGRGKGNAATANRNARTQPQTRTPAVVAAKSTAPDIATRTHEDIAHNIYECPICTSELGRRSKVWSCGLCWTVFHLSCIKKWSKNEGAVFARQQREEENGETNAERERQWRCPGCNLPQDVLPSTYTCWCGKEVDPKPVPGLPPHSCGQTCSRVRKGGHCPHPCDSICHAGPCQPCTSTGPTQSCFCGKQSSTKKCVDTDYVNGWSCGEVCGDLLPCGEHECRKECHEGLCGGCEEKVEVRCYCGKVEKEMLCSSKDEEEVSKQGGEGEWIGAFDCGQGCGRLFDCRIHSCEKECHPQVEEVPHCPQAPDMVSTCPCGKTSLQNIPGFTTRTSCEDPIPSCEEACGKKLPCQHPCPLICHTGPCPPCERAVDIKCRCGRSSFPAICHEGMEEPPKCERVCRTAMNCGRHSCGQECCPGERKAVERHATKRKLKSLSAASHMLDEDVEAEHVCTKICGRALKCGSHNCPDLCHRGSCGTCREAIFEEISCHCGRSVLHPPLPCGTKAPPCRFNCERPKLCGHPVTQHNCHPDSESCPKCPFLTEKKCLCGKQTLKNQPCWLTDARCGLVCGKTLKCGSHTCLKNCHRPGDCEDAITPCVQPCGKTKKLCSHPCTESCHAPFPCSEKTPCSAKVSVTCACGRLKQEKRCNASRGGNSKTSTQQPYRPTFTPLKCDDECSRLQRNRSLASALNIEIDPSTTLTTSDPSSNAATLPYSSDTLDKYISLSSTSTLPTLQYYESTLSSLATTIPATTSPSDRPSIRFKPARPSLRSFIHSLAEDWGFRSESYDPEPHRHVLVFKPAGWTLPVPFAAGIMAGKTGAVVSVGECVKIRERERIREKEEARIAALAAAEAAKNEGDASGGNVDGDGWAKVASRKKVAASAAAPGIGNPVTPVPWYGVNGNGAGAGAGSSTATTGNGKTGSLVLRSGVRRGVKATNGNANSNGFKPIDFGSDEDVVENWEEEVEREERARE